MVGDSKKAWVQPWKQPTGQRRFLSFVFWEGVLLTPLAVAYAYDTAGYWKLLAAVLPVLNVFLNAVQRYSPRAENGGADGSADSATVTFRSANQGDAGAEKLLFKIVRLGFIGPADAGDQAEYESFCRNMNLDQPAGGWGFVCCENEDGAHWTGLTPDAANLQQLDSEKADIRLSQCKIQEFRPGWPEEWTLLNPPVLPHNNGEPASSEP
jgi:hypothetical protein